MESILATKRRALLCIGPKCLDMFASAKTATKSCVSLFVDVKKMMMKQQPQLLSATLLEQHVHSDKHQYLYKYQKQILDDTFFTWRRLQEQNEEWRWTDMDPFYRKLKVSLSKQPMPTTILVGNVHLLFPRISARDKDIFQLTNQGVFMDMFLNNDDDDPKIKIIASCPSATKIPKQLRPYTSSFMFLSND